MRVCANVPNLAVALGVVVGSLVGMTGCFRSHEAPSGPLVAPRDSSNDGNRGVEPSDVDPGFPPNDVEPMGPPQPPADPPPEPPAAFSDEPVLIEAEAGLRFMATQRIVGDMDGDGVDDFVLLAIDHEQFETLAVSRPSYAFVFYGRGDLPSSLSTTDADAALRHDAPGLGQGVTGHALGDVNADGLADFAITTFDGVHLVFGSTQRLAGTHELADITAASWTSPIGTPEPDPAVFALPSARESLVAWPGGDVNGDGIADFVLSVATTAYAQPSGASQPFFATYLFHGHAGDWPSGDFDPVWATAELAVPDATRGCSFIASADLDGDGHTDLMVNAEDTTMRLVPGAPSLQGTVNVMEGSLPFFALYPRVWQLPDLDGDGSDEIVWRDSPGRPGVLLSYGGGELELPLSLALDAELGAVDEFVGDFDAADFDGDGVIDLILATSAVGSALHPPRGGLYVVPGGDTRLSDSVTLDERYLWVAGADEDGAGLVAGSFGSALDAGGDVTGDGIADILATVTMPDDDGPFPSTQVLLVPGGSERPIEEP